MRLTSVLQCISKLPKNHANFPEEYVKKQTEFVAWRAPKMINYLKRTIRYRKRAYYDEHRCWSQEFQKQNAPGIYNPKIYIEPFKYPIMYKGDRVEILSGADKGKQGIVNYVVEERNWVFVEGLNLNRKLIKQNKNNPGSIYCKEKPLLINHDVALIDPEDRKPTKIEWRYDEEGKKVRVSLRSERIIPIPSRAFETIDFKYPEAYQEQEKDTVDEDLKKQTFQYKLKTFEMDIMDEMGIKEEKTPFPMYWY